jgi:hypothetical protein
VDEHTEGPDQAKERQEDDAFFCEAGGGVFGVEEGTVEGTPEKGEVIFHERVSILAFGTSRWAVVEAHLQKTFDYASLRSGRKVPGYSISKYGFWNGRRGADFL